MEIVKISVKSAKVENRKITMKIKGIKTSSLRRSLKLLRFKTDLLREKTKAQITKVINNRGDITTESTDIS